jgi:hypothetical protein
MFESLKNAIGIGGAKRHSVVPSVDPKSASGRSGPAMQGTVGGREWRLEIGKSSRDYIKGTELRGRAELGLPDDIAVMVISRQLKNELDSRAFALYTDSLQTIVDPSLPEEMRWLSIYDEVGWEGLGHPFLNNYAVLTSNREHAMSWVGPEIVNLLMDWPTLNPANPKILMLLRGKAYLRMQHTAGDMATLEHASTLFACACEQAHRSLI